MGDYILWYTLWVSDFSHLWSHPISFPVEWDTIQIPGMPHFAPSVPNYHGVSAAGRMSQGSPAEFFTPAG